MKTIQDAFKYVLVKSVEPPGEPSRQRKCLHRGDLQADGAVKMYVWVLVSAAEGRRAEQSEGYFLMLLGWRWTGGIVHGPLEGRSSSQLQYQKTEQKEYVVFFSVTMRAVWPSFRGFLT